MFRIIATLVLALAIQAQSTMAFALTGCQSVAIPAYFWRAGTEWSRIFDVPAARSRTSVLVIPPCSAGAITPCVKPGDPRIPEYEQIIRRAKGFGIKVLAYVWTDYGNRPAASIKDEITRAKANYNLDGIFLDGVSAIQGRFSYYSDLSNHIRSTRGGFVAMNPGAMPGTELYMLIADLVITFEGNYNSYVAQYAAPAWTSSYPASKFWHLVHTTPNTVQALTNAIRLSEQRNAGSIYVTDDVFINPTDDPWNSLPTFFPTELALLKSRCG